MLSQALHGLRVVEISSGLAGAQCGHALAGLGAEVVVLRRPPAAGEAAQALQPLDALKHVASFDPWPAESFEPLVRRCADAVLLIEERPSQGWPAGGPLAPRLVQRLPRLIALCLSPFGLEGPHRDFAAFPLNTYHVGGHAQQIPCDPLRPQDAARAPLQAGAQWGEAQAGGLAAVAAVAALLDAEHHRGRVIDCSKQEALISFNWTDVARFFNEGRSPTRLAPLATIVGGILPAADGFVQIAVREDHQWAALAGLLGHPEWAQDPRLATRAARSERVREVATMLAEQTRRFKARHLHLAGRDAGIPIAAVMDWQALLDDADLQSRGAWRRDAPALGEDGFVVPAVPAAAADSAAGAGPAGIRLARWDACITTPTGHDLATPASSQPAARGATGLPLQGVRVIDLGWVAMGPYAGYLLAALGAQVIHVGRPARSVGGGVELNAYNYGYDTLNTGKTWVDIDLKRPAGRYLVRELVAGADILLENFRPGVAQRLGLGYAALSALNPRLVMLSASTYGQQHMAGEYVGYAPVFAALSGLSHATGHADGPPTEVSTPVDFFAGSVGVLALLAGMHRRAATGAGCHIDLAAREAMLWSLSHELSRVQAGHRDGARLGNAHPDMAPHGVYRCRGENRWVAIVIANDAQWQRLCQLLGQPAHAQDTRLRTLQDRLSQREEVDRLVESWTASREAGALVDALQAAGIAATLSCTSEDLCRDHHLAATGAFLRHETARGPGHYLAAPWRVSGQPRHALDTCTGDAAVQSVFADLLCLPPQRIEALLAEGTIAAR